MVVLVGAGLAACDSDRSDASGGQACTYEGRTYPNRVSWMAADGCNECSCLDGNVGCSGLVCDAGMPGDYSCLYEGQSYPPGVTFPASDGCNICECTWRWYHDVTPGPWEAACTLDGCGGSGGKVPVGDAGAAACTYGGKTYPTDVYFPSVDGCDECHCRTDGLVTCTFLHTGCK